MEQFITTLIQSTMINIGIAIIITIVWLRYQSTLGLKEWMIYGCLIPINTLMLSINELYPTSFYNYLAHLGNFIVILSFAFMLKGFQKHYQIQDKFHPIIFTLFSYSFITATEYIFDMPTKYKM